MCKHDLYYADILSKAITSVLIHNHPLKLNEDYDNSVKIKAVAVDFLLLKEDEGNKFKFFHHLRNWDSPSERYSCSANFEMRQNNKF